jgi:hypothetical protein
MRKGGKRRKNGKKLVYGLTLISIALQKLIIINFTCGHFQYFSFVSFFMFFSKLGEQLVGGVTGGGDGVAKGNLCKMAELSGPTCHPEQLAIEGSGATRPLHQ